MKDELYNKVLGTIRRHRLFLPDEKVLVAVSGGADSVALLRILLRTGCHCEVAHCNFHLRGEESDRDERFVRDLCRAHSLRLFVEDFDTASYAREKGVSIEMAAREQRYAYFEKLRSELRFDKIAVAHHRDDNVETMLLNLVRGTGLKGLGGMHYRNGAVVRPLLDVSREELELYLSEIGQSFVTDSTNLEADVARNKIRLEVLPMLKALNPSVADALQEAIRHAQDAYVLYRVAVDEMKARVFDGRRIDMAALRGVPAAPTVLFELLSPYGFNGAQAEEIWEQMDGGAGKVYQSAEWRLLRDRDSWVLERKDEPYECLCPVLPLEGFVRVAPDLAFSIRRVHRGPDFSIPTDKGTACLDLEKLEYPITVRRVETGDRFTPLGMKGTKLVSDFLTDCKKSVFEKERQLVVCSGGKIAWLVGERIDDRYRIGDDTTRMLVVQAVKD